MLPSLVSFFCKVDYLLSGRNSGNARTGRHKHPRFLPSSPHQSSRLHLPSRTRTPGPPEQAGQNVLAPPGWGRRTGRDPGRGDSERGERGMWSRDNCPCVAPRTGRGHFPGRRRDTTPHTAHLPRLIEQPERTSAFRGHGQGDGVVLLLPDRGTELHPPIADLLHSWLTTLPDTAALLREPDKAPPFAFPEPRWSCLLYTSDAADEEDSVDL